MQTQRKTMNKRFIILGGGALLILIALVVMCSPSTPDAKSLGIYDATNPAPKGEPIATEIDFQIYWEKHMRNEEADTARISATLAAHPDWIQGILPSDFDGQYLQLTAGHWRIIYPYTTKDIINRTKLLKNVVSTERLPKDVKLLIEKGGDVNAPGVMLKAKSTEMIEYLISKGADPNTTDEDGFYPYDIFMGSGSKDKALMLKKHGGHGKDN